MWLLTEFSLEKEVSWPKMMTGGVQENGLNLGISWTYNQEDLDGYHVVDEVIKDNLVGG